MGRYYWSKKTESNNLKKIEIWWLRKHGYLKNGYHLGGIKWTSEWPHKESNIGFSVSINENSYLQLRYTTADDNEDKQDFDYKIPLTTTPCYFGGKRYWFICPWYVNEKYCGRRIGVLYLGDKYFACRHCYNLTYNSRNLSGISKTAGQIISIPELERMEKEIKRKHYAGKMTKKYKRYLKKQEKSFYQLQVVAEALKDNK